jgi:hypothetical protein
MRPRGARCHTCQRQKSTGPSPTIPERITDGALSKSERVECCQCPRPHLGEERDEGDILCKRRPRRGPPPPPAPHTRTSSFD